MSQLRLFILFTFLFLGLGSLGEAQELNTEGSSDPIFLQKAHSLQKSIDNGQITNRYVKNLIMDQAGTLVGFSGTGSVGFEPWFNTNPTDILKILINFSVGMIPEVGDFLNLFINLFWPAKSQKNLFEELKSQIEELVGEKIDANTWQILGGKLNELSEKLRTYHELIDKAKVSQDPGLWGPVIAQYQVISTYFVGLDENFKLQGESRPYFFTPLYRAFIDLVVGFRLDCILNGKALHLSDAQISTEQTLIHDIVFRKNGAKEYISEQLKILQDNTREALTKIPVGQGNNNDYNNVLNLFNYYNTALSGEVLLEKRADNPLDNSYVNIRVMSPGKRYGDFSPRGISTSTELFNIMYDVPLGANNDFAAITKITLSEMKPGEPEYKRIAGVEVQYDNGKVERQGYFGGDANTLQKSYPMDFTVENTPFTAEIYNTGSFLDQVSITDNNKNTVTAGGHNGGDPITIGGGIYKIGKIYFDDDANGYSGHQTAGGMFTLVWDNNKAKNLTFDDITKIIDNINY